MRLEDLRRTTTFRLTMLYGVLFALGTLALVWMIYLRSAVYLTSRVDGILATEADALARTPAGQISSSMALSGVAGNGARSPSPKRSAQCKSRSLRIGLRTGTHKKSPA